MRSVVIAVGIKDNGKTMEQILAAEDFAGFRVIFHVPNSHAISVEVLPFTVHFKVHLEVPVFHFYGDCVPQRPCTALFIRREPYLVCCYEGVAC